MNEPLRPDPEPRLEPRRPELEPRPAERLRNRVDEWRLNSGRPSFLSASAQEPSERRVPGAGLIMTMIGTGLVLVLVAAIWGWTMWSNRSSVLIDDELPFLVNAESALGRASPAVDGEAASGSETTTESGLTADGAGGATGVPPAEADAAASRPIDPIDPIGPIGPIDPIDPIGPIGPIVVHVSGAVNAPGIVELDLDARVHEAVDGAGGALPEADLNRVNLAALLRDGEQIHIPHVGQDELPELVAPQRSTSAGLAPALSEPDSTTEAPLLVDLNHATVPELELLPGVGPSIAQAIVDLRDQRGPYATVDELLLVGGVGPAKLAALRAFAVVG